MSLTVGARLGPYEIGSPLGAGGMGEVYRARDTRLDRTVAIKILPAEFASDPDLRARFEREARAIAALDHPHICAIYDVGEAAVSSQLSAVSTDTVRFLVMPYLDGETLQQRLARAKGPLPLDQALTIAIQIADALDKAHRAGITHRDLKPANIMLVRSGGASAPPTAKLLDFGLAKLRGPAAPISMSGMTRLATPTPNTAHGTILGTVHYMAPEQVEGREADARADIWALGVVVYEMLTGQRPFDGASAASVIGSILKDVPASLSVRQPLAPRMLDQAVQRCLAKDADDRWQSAADVRIALEWVSSGDYPDLRSSRVARTPRLLASVAAVLLLLGAAAVAGFRYLAGAPGIGVVQFQLVPPADAMLSPAPVAGAAQVALSADGRQIAYIALKRRGTSQIYVRSIDSRESRALPGTDGASFPFWSPDGRSIGFFANRKLNKITIAEGTVQALCDAPNGRGATWNADGTILFAMTYTTGLFRISSSGGERTRVTSLGSDALGHEWPQFLPDGHHFLYYQSGAEGSHTGVFAADLGNPAEARRVLDVRGLATYASGYLAFSRDGILFAQAFDERTLRTSGAPIRIADGLGYFSERNGYSTIAVSPGGMLAFGPPIQMTTSLQWFTRDGTMTGRLGRPDVYSSPRLSFDDRSVAVAMSGQTLAERDVWTFDVARNTASRVTSDPAVDWFPAWSPDGSRMFFGSTRLGVSSLFQKEGVGQDQPVDPDAGRVVAYPNDVSSDGRLLAFTQSTENGYDLGVITLGPPVRKAPFLATTFNEIQPRFAPNTRFIAYTSDETGAFEVYVRPYPAGKTQWKVSLAGGSQPEWRRDGRELFFVSADSKMMAVPVSIDGDFRAGAPHALFDVDVPEGTAPYVNNYTVTADGQRFLVNTVVSQSSRPALTVIINWTAALKKAN